MSELTETLLEARIKQGIIVPSGMIDRPFYMVAEDSEIRGIYAMSVKGSPYMLASFCIDNVTQFETAMSQNKHTRSTAVLHVRDRYDAQHSLHYSDERMKNGSFYNDLLGRMTALESVAAKNKLMEAIKAVLLLYRHKLLTISQSFGWNANYTVWYLANGAESMHGFSDKEHTSAIGPNDSPFLSFYSGQSVSGNLEPDVLLMLLRDYLPKTGETTMMALLGLASRSMLRLPQASHNRLTYPGLTRLPTLVLGAHGVGKNTAINYFCSMFGIGFSWDTPPISNDVDTSIGRNETLACMGYSLYAHLDIKSRPGQPNYERIYQSFANAVSAQFDAKGGGTVGERTGGKRQRASPLGLGIATANHDLIAYALEKGDDAIIDRLTVIEWPKDDDEKSQHASQNVSVAINNRVTAFYAIGYHFRHWMMKHSENEWSYLYHDVSDTASRMVRIHKWHSERQQENCKHLMLGLLIFQQFLQESVPNAEITKWLQDRLASVVLTRYAQSESVELEQVKKQDTLAKTSIDALLHAIEGQQVFIVGQNGKYLQKNEEVPSYLRCEHFGYTDNFKKHAHSPIGYLLRDQNAIGFKITESYELIKTYCKSNGHDIPSRKDLEKALLEGSTIVPGIERGKPSAYRLVRIANARVYLWVVPLDILYSYNEACDIEDETNIIPINQNASKNTDVVIDAFALALSIQD